MLIKPDLRTRSIRDRSKRRERDIYIYIVREIKEGSIKRLGRFSRCFENVLFVRQTSEKRLSLIATRVATRGCLIESCVRYTNGMQIMRDQGKSVYG